MGYPLIRATLAIIAGAALLSWPIALNGYPIIFSDSGALLDMGFLPSMGWDKPFVYGPFAAATSLGRSLLFTAAGQTVLLSYMLWATQSAFAEPTPSRHIALSLALGLTAAPWFASTILPDAFTAIAVLGLLTFLGNLPRRHTLPVFLLSAVAIASHLSHLVLAGGMIAGLALCRLRVPWRPILALMAALSFLLASNFVGRGRFAISPYGSIFALARLIGDGPARDYLARTCPDPALLLCQYQSQLTDDSDQFLWDPASPFWSDPLPLADFAGQASTIVAGTIRAEPGRVLRAAYGNAVSVLIRVDLGDTLVPDFLADTVRPRLERWFPIAELARFDRSRQVGGTLTPALDYLLPLQRAVLLVTLVACTVLLVHGLFRPDRRADLAALILIALASNAFATGALSAIHDRYAARVTWVLLVPLLLRIKQPGPRYHSPSSALR